MGLVVYVWEEYKRGDEHKKISGRVLVSVEEAEMAERKKSTNG